jgi:hypothetical protein
MLLVELWADKLKYDLYQLVKGCFRVPTKYISVT